MDNIPKNQIKSRNTIEQREHHDDAAARRVIPVDEAGNVVGGLKPANFDDVQIVRDSDDDPVQYRFFLASTLVGTIDVTYNANKSSVRYKKGLNMSSPKDKQELVFNPVTGELDTVLKFNPDRIITHEKNAAGNPIVTFDPISNTHMTLEGQIVIDAQGNVVTV